MTGGVYNARERIHRDIADSRFVRGMGLLLGIQLPADFAAGTLSRKLLERGFVAGTASGNVLRIAPPLIISYEEMDAFVEALNDELK